MKRKLQILLIIISIFPMFGSCKKDENYNKPYTPGGTSVNGVYSFATDKARYNLGEKVAFNLSLSANLSGILHINYSHLGTTIEEKNITIGNINQTWEWTPPATDFKGYLVTAVLVNGKDTVAQGVTAVDVSSDWTRFPRYGFLSYYTPGITESQIKAVIDNLKNFHINGLQFYDWHNKHHWPLKMNGSQPAATWTDIGNRPISFDVVKNYITASRNSGIGSMFYNLLFGTWNDGEADGVAHEWYLFNNQAATDINKMSLPSSWASSIYLVNPGLPAWQDYLGVKTADVFKFLDFDGYHVDQLGSRGNLYSASGQAVDLAKQYQPFLVAMKTKFPTRKFAMNAVNQYGQEGILKTQVDFAYSEVWDPNNTYENLVNVILQNNQLSSNKLNTVLAAYMNYDRANSTGFFNEAGVLYTDAIITAFGGSHLELGEHMLCKEYFPNNNLQMTTSLKTNLLNYYHFLVAYQNLLRDGGTFSFENKVSSSSSIEVWPATVGSIASFSKLLPSNKEVFHLINFNGANSMLWRDANGTQTSPNILKNNAMTLKVSGTAKKVWAASPDNLAGEAQSLVFTQNGSNVSVNLPFLKYWTMIVVEY